MKITQLNLDFEPKLKVLVTGGLGFFGSNFVNGWNQVFDITILDAYKYCANINNLTDKSKETCEIITADIYKDFNILNDIVSDFDVIINFAAETHVDNSIKDPSSFYTTNYLGVVNILEALKRNKDKKETMLIHISTDEVYGDATDYGYAVEDTNYNPSSPYSASKAAADMLIHAYSRTYGMKNLYIRRFTNLIGKNQFPEKLVPMFIKNVLNRKKQPIYGDGSQIREWTPVEDACFHLAQSIHELNVKCGGGQPILNMALGIEKTNKEILEMILEELNPDKDVDIEDHISYVQDRPGHDFSYCIKSYYFSEHNKVKEDKFRQYLKSYVQHYKEKVKNV